MQGSGSGEAAGSGSTEADEQKVSIGPSLYIKQTWTAKKGYTCVYIYVYKYICIYIYIYGPCIYHATAWSLWETCIHVGALIAQTECLCL